jgi:hypothetical protein
MQSIPNMIFNPALYIPQGYPITRPETHPPIYDMSNLIPDNKIGINQPIQPIMIPTPTVKPPQPTPPIMPVQPVQANHPVQHGRQPARENDHERFELLHLPRRGRSSELRAKVGVRKMWHVYFIWRVSVQRDGLEGWTAMNGRNSTQRRATIIQFQHGSLHRTDVAQKLPLEPWADFFPSADPEGRFLANKKIHERGIVGREEFVPVRLG